MRVDESDSAKVKASQFNEYLGELSEGKWVIYNYRSGAMLDLSKKLYDAVKNSDSVSIENKEVVDTLYRCRLYVTNDSIEHEELLAEKKRLAEENKVIGLQILPTLGCNFRCTYCYEGLEHNTAKMSDETIEDIINYVKSVVKPTTDFLNVSWFGGEPLLAVKQIEKLSKEFLLLSDSNELQYMGSMISNGYLLNAKNIELMLKNRISSCQVTIDGLKKYHDSTRILGNGIGTWDVIMKNTVMAVNMGLKITIRVNLDRNNSRELDEFVKELEERNIAEKVQLSFSIVQDLGQKCSSAGHGKTLTLEEADNIIKGKELTKKYLDDERDKTLSRALPDMFGCVATAARSLIIGPEGELYKCSKTIGEKKMLCGDISNVQREGAGLNRWVMHDNCRDERCSKCNMLPVCPGIGCAYDAIVHGKDVFDCDIEKIRQFHVDKLKKLYLRKQKIAG